MNSDSLVSVAQIRKSKLNNENIISKLQSNAFDKPVMRISN